MNVETPTQIILPTIFGMKTVNAWFFRNPEPTLIDCGENSDETFKHLEQQLSDINIQIKDLKHLYITHAHVDHIGMAHRIQKLSGCKVYVNPDSYDWAINFNTKNAKRKELISSKLTSLFGKDHLFLTMFKSFFDQTPNYWEELDAETVAIIDWESDFELGGASWTNMHTPGHCNHQGIYVDRANGRIISSDMLMSITPTTVLDPVPKGLSKEKQGLRALLHSYNLLSKIDFDVAYPGHYNIIDKPKITIKTQVSRIHKRIDEAYHFLMDNPLNFEALLHKMYPNNTSFPAIVMLIAYLDILIQDSRIHTYQKNGMNTYEKV